MTLIVLASGTTIVAVLLATNQNVEQNTVDRLEVGQKVFEQLLEYRGNQLFDSAQLLTADFGFKSAVSAGDKETISSALENHGQRINADLMLLVSLEGEFVARAGLEQDSPDISFERLISQAEAEGGLLTNIVLSQKLYQIIVVPVLAPVPIAWAVVGFDIDATLAEELKLLTNLDVTIIGDTDSSEMVYTSTMERADVLIDAKSRLKLVDESSTSLQMAERDEITIFRSDAEEQIIHLKSALDSGGGSMLYSVLSESLGEEFQRFGPLRVQLSLISVITLLISVVGAVVISSNISRPITDLVRATQKISGGDYSDSISVRRSSSKEITALASSIQTMQQGIAEREKHIVYQLYHDTLTELPNRNKLNEDLSKLLESLGDEDGFLLFELNLNRFKQINDTFGLEIGDKLLQAVAQRLSERFSQKALISHQGADEFALVITAERQQLEDLVEASATEIEDCLATPFCIDDIEISVSARFGVVQFPADGVDPGQLLRRVNIALTQAKEKKLHLARYQEGADQEHVKKIMLINDLKLAIENDELSMHYQPKVDLESQAVAQAEALIRWTHPEIGFVSPAEFIPLAEQSGLMPDLTRWVLGAVVKQLTLWRNEEIPIGVAVNLSAHDLVSEELPNHVVSMLQTNGLSADDLILEVTESAVMEDTETSLKVLNCFRELGFVLSIDDYGTGYSSLSQLKKMPVQELKIDMSFVRNLASDTDDQVIVKSTIEMAHNIGMKVVAEGVEDHDSWSLLQDWQCDKLQGYFISRPLPPEAFASWYKSFDAKAVQAAS